MVTGQDWVTWLSLNQSNGQRDTVLWLARCDTHKHPSRQRMMEVVNKERGFLKISETVTQRWRNGCWVSKQCPLQEYWAFTGLLENQLVQHCGPFHETVFGGYWGTVCRNHPFSEPSDRSLSLAKSFNTLTYSKRTSLPKNKGQPLHYPLQGWFMGVSRGPAPQMTRWGFFI